MKKKKSELRKEVEKYTGTTCFYCEKNPVKYFCLECSWSCCGDCMEEEYMGKCMGECWDNLPDVVDIDILDS